jgi:hypothetical protein
MFDCRRALGLAIVCGAFACKKAPESAPPPRGLPLTDETVAAPSGHAHAEHAPGPSGMQGEAGGELPPGHPAIGGERTPGDIPFDPSSMVKGELRLDAKVKSKVQDGDVIFLMARVADAAGEPGQLLAVKKLAAGRWPQEFELDGRDAMMTGTKMQGRVVITARVDKDGDAISKNPGDVTGKSKAVELPANKVIVTLDTVL